jgi:hypothetical protein
LSISLLIFFSFFPADRSTASNSSPEVYINKLYIFLTLAAATFVRLLQFVSNSSLLHHLV